MAQRSGFEASLNEQQRTVLDGVKAALAKTDFAEDVARQPDGDRFLLRFLRATMLRKNSDRIFVQEKAVDRILRTMEWRREHKVDELRRLLETGGVLPEGYERYRSEIRPALETIHPATGQPVRYERFGLLAQHLNTHHFSMEAWITYFALDMERLLLTMRRESAAKRHEVSTTIVIIDESGVGMGLLSRLNVFNVMNHIASEFYPEQIEHIFVLKAPWIFSTLWSLTKGLIDPDTVNKVTITNGLATQELLRMLPADLVPEELGGKWKTQVPIPLDARGVWS